MKQTRLEDRTIVEAINSWASGLGVKENLHVEAGGNNYMAHPVMGPENELSVALVFRLKVSPFSNLDMRHQLYDQLGEVEQKIHNSPSIKHDLEKMGKENELLKKRAAELEKYETYFKMQMELNHGPEIIVEVKK